MTRHSPIRMYPSPLVMHQAARRREGISPAALWWLGVVLVIWGAVALCCWAGLR